MSTGRSVISFAISAVRGIRWTVTWPTKRKSLKTLDRSVKKNSAGNKGSPPGEKIIYSPPSAWIIVRKMLKLKSELVADFAKPVMNPIYVVYSEDRNLLIFAEFDNLIQNDLSSLAD